MGYDNVKLWFAKDENEQVVTIDEVSYESNHTYSCPICGSNLIPKAIKSKQVSSHFAHVDVSKCNSETMIHWWFKNKFLEKGDKFIVVSDQEREYICKDVLVEMSCNVEDKLYTPDVTVLTECGNTIYFEMDYSNKKQIKDYIDIWLALKNIVVEIDVKKMMFKREAPKFKALFYGGKCFNVRGNDSYYYTIGKYKEEKFNEIDKKSKERIQNLDWFWDDVFRYKSGEVDIEHMAMLIDNIDGDERYVVNMILKKSMCSQLYKDYKDYKSQDCVHYFEEIMGKDDIIKKSVEIINKNYRSIDRNYKILLNKQSDHDYETYWFKGKKRKRISKHYYSYSIALYHKEYYQGEWAIDSVDITNRIYNFKNLEAIVEHVESKLNKHRIRFQCNDCNNTYYLEFGEIKFYNEKGLNLPRRCKNCRKLKNKNESEATI